MMMVSTQTIDVAESQSLAAGRRLKSHDAVLPYPVRSAKENVPRLIAGDADSAALIHSDLRPRGPLRRGDPPPLSTAML